MDRKPLYAAQVVFSSEFPHIGWVSLRNSVAPGEARDILSGLRESEGYAQASARIEIVSE